MHGISNSTMSKAAGRAGRLAEAMTLVRRVLAEARQAGVAADGVRASTVASDSGNVQSLGHGSAFTTSLLGARWPKDGFAKEISGGSAGIEMPDAMRGFLDQVGQLGSLPGMSGLGSSFAKAPPASLPAGARFEEYLYSNAAGTRAYKLYVPSGYNDQQSLPLVVMMHGCTQSPDDFAAGTRMNELAEEQMFLVAYPAQSQSANVSKCWNWFNASDQQRDTGEPSLIAGITRQILQDFPVDPKRVYIAGLSAGGATAAIMGSVYPDLYAAVGVHSGLACGAAVDMPSAFTAMRQGGVLRSNGPQQHGRVPRPVPTIVFHGDGDKTVHPANGEQVIAQSQGEAEFDSEISTGESAGGMAYTRTVQTDPAGQPVLEHWVLHGAGHAWSGGSSAGSYTVPRGPDASREMLRFFFDHANTAAAAFQGTPKSVSISTSSC